MYKYCVQGEFRVRENLISTTMYANGQSCSNSNECASRFCYNKKCADKFDVNQSCSKDYECKSNYCNNLKCALTVPQNGKCSIDNECETKKCDSNKKVCIRKNGGEKCTLDNECKSKKCKGFTCMDSYDGEGQ